MEFLVEAMLEGGEEKSPAENGITELSSADMKDRRNSDLSVGDGAASISVTEIHF